MRESFPDEIYNRAWAESKARAGKVLGEGFDPFTAHAQYYIAQIRVYLAGIEVALTPAEPVAADEAADDISLLSRLILPKSRLAEALALASKYGITLLARAMSVDEALERLQNARERYAETQRDPRTGVEYVVGYRREFSRGTAKMLADQYVVVDVQAPEGTDGVQLIGVATDSGFRDPRTDKPVLQFADMSDPPYWTEARRETADLYHCDRCNRRVYRTNVYIGRSRYASAITNTRIGQYGGECASALGLDRAFKKLLKGLAKIDELLSEDPESSGGFFMGGEALRLRPLAPAVLVAIIDVLLRSNEWISSKVAYERGTESTARAIGDKIGILPLSWFVAEIEGQPPYPPRDADERARAEFWIDAIDAYFTDSSRQQPTEYLRALMREIEVQLDEAAQKADEKALKDWAFRARVAYDVGAYTGRFSGALASIVHMARRRMSDTVVGADNLSKKPWAPQSRPTMQPLGPYDLSPSEVPLTEWPRLAEQDGFPDILAFLAFYKVKREDYDAAVRAGKPLPKSKMGAVPQDKKGTIAVTRGVWLVTFAERYEGDYGVTYKARLLRNDGTTLRVSGKETQDWDRGDRVRVLGGSVKYLAPGYGRDGRKYDASYTLSGVVGEKTDAPFVSAGQTSIENPPLPSGSFAAVYLRKTR